MAFSLRSGSQIQLRRIQRLQSQGRQAACEKALRRLLVSHPREPQALFALARLLESRQDPAALSWYRRAVAVQPRHHDAWYRLGLLYEQRRQLAEALLAYGRCLRLQTAPVSLYLHLAGVLLQAGQMPHALELYLQALQREPDNPHILLLLAQLLQWMGDQETALDVLMTLGRLYPEHLALISFLMGYALEKQSQPEAARQCYDEALRRQPRQLIWQLKRDLVRALVPATTAGLRQDFLALEDALDRTLARLRHQPVTLPREQLFYLAMIHGSLAVGVYAHTPQLHLRLALAELVQRVALKPPAWQVPEPVLRSRLRLGILIAPRSLVLGYLCAVGMADRLDPAEFEVLLLSPSLEVAGLFQPEAPFRVTGPHLRWQLIPTDPYQAVGEIRALQLDALFLTEPGWDFDQYLLALFRVAPLQFTSWMSPGTTGLANMDVYLSSTLIEPPQAQDGYSESLVCWPTLPSWLPAISFPAPVPRSDFGLQDDWHVYACLQNILKFHPDFDSLLGEILRQDPLGQVVMVSAREHQPLVSQLMKRFEQRIPDVMDRIWVFPELSNLEFMQLLQCSDVALDPLYFGGGATTYQSLLCGLPLVSLPGEQMVGRVALGMAQQLDVCDGIVHSEAEYIARAVALAQDPAWRADIRQRTLTALPRLVEDAAAVACFAEFLHRHCRLEHPLPGQPV